MYSSDSSQKFIKMCRSDNQLGRLEMTHNAISEPELLISLKTNSVKNLVIKQDGKNRYCLVAEIKCKEGNQSLVLHTQRGKPRVWSSMDRMLNHVLKKYGIASFSPIKLEIKEHGEPPT